MDATTNRPMTFIRKDKNHVVVEITKRPAGTLVHVTRIKDNRSCVARIPSTLLEMEIHVNDVTPA